MSQINRTAARALSRHAVAIDVAIVTTISLALGCCVPIARSAAPFHAPPVPKYLHGLGRPTTTGYNIGDGGVPYDCDFWKLGSGKFVVEFCVVDNHVGATLTGHKI